MDYIKTFENFKDIYFSGQDLNLIISKDNKYILIAGNTPYGRWGYSYRANFFKGMEDILKSNRTINFYNFTDKDVNDFFNKGTDGKPNDSFLLKTDGHGEWVEKTFNDKEILKRSDFRLVKYKNGFIKDKEGHNTIDLTKGETLKWK